MTKIKDIDGLPVIDAKRPIKLIVKQTDVDRADIKEPWNCAVARACKRELHAEEVRVHLSRVYVKTSPDKWTRYFTPRDMRSEIIAFDRGGQFEPGQFLLTPPPKGKAVGSGQQGGKWPSHKKSKNPRKPAAVTKNVRLGPA